MKTETNSITIRLSKAERDKINEVTSNTSITASQYIRSLINDTPIVTGNSSAKVASQLCKIYVALEERGFAEDEKIMKELNDLCQILSL